MKINQNLMKFFQEITNKIKNGAYVINLDECVDVGIHLITLFCRNIEIVYFDNFGVEQVPEEIKDFIENISIKANIFRAQASNLLMGGCFCIRFIDFMLADKTLTDFTSLFSPDDFF